MLKVEIHSTLTKHDSKSKNYNNNLFINFAAKQKMPPNSKKMKIKVQCKNTKIKELGKEGFTRQFIQISLLRSLS